MTLFLRLNQLIIIYHLLNVSPPMSLPKIWMKNLLHYCQKISTSYHYCYRLTKIWMNYHPSRKNQKMIARCWILNYRNYRFGCYFHLSMMSFFLKNCYWMNFWMKNWSTLNYYVRCWN